MGLRPSGAGEELRTRSHGPLTMLLWTSFSGAVPRIYTVNSSTCFLSRRVSSSTSSFTAWS